MQEKQFDYRSVILVFLLIAGLLVLLLLNRNKSYNNSVQQVPIRIGFPAPDFSFFDIKGKKAGIIVRSRLALPLR